MFGILLFLAPFILLGVLIGSGMLLFKAAKHVIRKIRHGNEPHFLRGPHWADHFDPRECDTDEFAYLTGATNVMPISFVRIIEEERDRQRRRAA